jgi:O-methyltransferase involved in polyketide biosynthesis
MSHEALVTRRGRILYMFFYPFMWIGRTFFGISDMVTGLQQRHIILDHLMEKAFHEKGIRQFVELASGLSPRGYRFMKKHKGQDVTYLEADLPQMAERKKKILANAGLLEKGHDVVACDILTDSGDIALTQVAQQHLDPQKPTAVITEGLVFYFDPVTVRGVWKRIRKMLKEGSGGMYLTDDCPEQRDHPCFFLLDGFMKIIGLISRGKIFYHFDSEKTAKEAFRELLFEKTTIHTPESLYQTLPIPRSKLPGFIRVIEAQVRTNRWPGPVTKRP